MCIRDSIPPSAPPQSWPYNTGEVSPHSSTTQEYRPAPPEPRSGAATGLVCAHPPTTVRTCLPPQGPRHPSCRGLPSGGSEFFEAPINRE
eukprot:14953712-Alexandrium_andersonii.AAC.1